MASITQAVEVGASKDRLYDDKKLYARILVLEQIYINNKILLEIVIVGVLFKYKHGYNK